MGDQKKTALLGAKLATTNTLLSQNLQTTAAASGGANVAVSGQGNTIMGIPLTTILIGLVAIGVVVYMAKKG